jgi:hypothetical protein
MTTGKWGATHPFKPSTNPRTSRSMAASSACTDARSGGIPTTTRVSAQDGRDYRISTSNAKSMRKPCTAGPVVRTVGQSDSNPYRNGPQAVNRP